MWQASNLRAVIAQLEEGGWLMGRDQAHIKQVKLPMSVAGAGGALKVDE